jgi:hypothetical protein
LTHKTFEAHFFLITNKPVKQVEVTNIKEVFTMADYFAEKAAQIEPGALTAFGIVIDSRYSQANELAQLLRFAESTAQKNVAHYVKRAFYDSKAGMCFFELDQSVEKGDPIAEVILQSATECVDYFDWFGSAEYGGELTQRIFAIN